jgi:hypothetical protein
MVRRSHGYDRGVIALITLVVVLTNGANLGQDTAMERCLVIPGDAPASLRRAGTNITVSWGITGYTREYRRGGRLIYKVVRRDLS